MTSYLTTPVPPTVPDREIAERIDDVRFLFYQSQSYLPDHPAVTLIEDFINHNNPSRLDVSDKDTITTDAAAYLYDVRRMDEVKMRLAVLKQLGSRATKGRPILFARQLGAQSIYEQLKYPFQFAGDLYTNTTRALLGSYSGMTTATEIGAGKIIWSFEITNPLTWESLTRFPPALGGYEGGNSYVPHIPGWDIQMTFQWREVVSFKN